ncbi:exported hypothetical protein [Nostocoides japonicum T1-X7]|uniref:Right handed beta helix domain-containing protein n=1 Tax=Nostocoides japonicum T1-X7 TaxID=1194083 RepID=A0A077M1T9_9MICO|nr:hypothetical protein [Tetrasphaera japonica]CCH78164.1 exported hypothetical protein [Tetrasphaera japonica T1-X7]
MPRNTLRAAIALSSCAAVLPAIASVAHAAVDPNASPSAGKTIVVSPGSGTLQKAMDAASPGTTIRLHAGVYKGVAAAHKSGTASAPIVIQPYGDGVVTVAASLPAPNCRATSPNPNRTFKFDNGVDYWTVQGLNIQGGVWISAKSGGKAQHYLGGLVNKHDWQTRRSIPGRGSNDPSAARNAISVLSQRTHTTINPADGIQILNNNITGRGIHTIASRYGKIIGNEIHNTQCGIGPGIWINTYSDGWTVSNNYIHDITPSPKPVHHYMYEGVRLGSASAYNTVSNNKVANIPSDGRAFNTDVDASWNVFTHNTASGVALGYNDQMSGWGNQWTYNTVTSPRTAGFSFRAMDSKLSKPSMDTSTNKTLVKCNTVNGGVGLQIGAIMNSTFVGNKFATVQLGKSLQSYWGKYGNTWNGSSKAPSKQPGVTSAGC